MKRDTHICLISDQAIPNLVPVIDPAMRVGRVIQLVSESMSRQAGWLRDVLARRGMKVDQWLLGDPFDIEKIQFSVLELLERETRLVEDNSIVLNATGGTKPMSIAAYEACRAWGLPIYYVHPEKDRIIWLHGDGLKNRDLADRVKLEDFLAAHGVTVVGTPWRNIPDPRLLRTAEQVVDSISRYTRPLRALNSLAASAKGGALLSEPVGDVGDDLAALIDLFAASGFLEHQGDRLRFPDEAARFYANGGWLEYLVFDAIRSLRAEQTQIHDIARALTIERRVGKDRVRNELDVVFLRNNRLHVIECKTRQFRGEGEHSPGAEALYKLDHLAELAGGLKARAMLVSFMDLPGEVRARARSHDIHVCGGQQLNSLITHIRTFIQA